jgi:hypothetical protein
VTDPLLYCHPGAAESLASDSQRRIFALPNGEAALVTRTGGNGTILQMQVRSSSPAQRSQ